MHPPEVNTSMTETAPERRPSTEVDGYPLPEQLSDIVNHHQPNRGFQKKTYLAVISFLLFQGLTFIFTIKGEHDLRSYICERDTYQPSVASSHMLYPETLNTTHCAPATYFTLPNSEKTVIVCYHSFLQQVRIDIQYSTHSGQVSVDLTPSEFASLCSMYGDIYAEIRNLETVQGNTVTP